MASVVDDWGLDPDEIVRTNDRLMTLRSALREFNTMPPGQTALASFFRGEGCAPSILEGADIERISIEAPEIVADE
jgi:hypothetical protein